MTPSLRGRRPHAVGVENADDDTKAQVGSAAAEIDACEPLATSATDDLSDSDTTSDAGVVRADVGEGTDSVAAAARLRTRQGRRQILVFVALPIVALALAGGAAFLKWQANSMQQTQRAVAESVAAATDGTIKMLSYRPDTAAQDLAAARDRMTGKFRDDYIKLTDDVVIPGAKQKNISAAATVPAASSVSATADHAVVLVFVDQTIIIGSDPPTSTASSVRVTLDKHEGQWLMSAFDPI